MNNNQRRRLERRRNSRRRRGQHGTDPLATPPAAGTLCAVCGVRAAVTKAEIGVAGIAGSLVFPLCSPCLAAAPAVIERYGFRNYRELVRRNMRNTADAGAG